MLHDFLIFEKIFSILLILVHIKMTIKKCYETYCLNPFEVPYHTNLNKT